ncbi:MAG: MFS transporter, partial [Bacteroidota bacterium]|nr:MFS transporter [Bacteroidota bacterium]
MLKGHPKGLMVLALANMGERFGYYTMLAILALYIQAKFGLNSKTTSLIYGTFLALVYFLPLLGGLVADKLLGYGRTILLGITVMFGGYALLSIPGEANTIGYITMFSALFLIALGTGFFKGNLQALVGNLYEDKIYSSKRDIAFSIFYMFINIGAFFAPSTANFINNSILAKENYSYDAAIPTNVVKLNDKVVDETNFKTRTLTAYDKTIKTAKDSDLIIKQAKKKEGVMFQADKDKALFKIKAAGLVQDKKLSLAEYRQLDSNDKKIKEAVTAKINQLSFNAEEFASKYMTALTRSYNWAFGIACGSLLISVLIFLGFRKQWKPVDLNLKQQLASNNNNAVILTRKQVKERIAALIMVFIVVIFFWMSFHQNGLCMTYFARDYTVNEISPLQNIAFSLLSLIPLIFVFYGIYMAAGLFGTKKQPV